MKSNHQLAMVETPTFYLHPLHISHIAPKAESQIELSKLFSNHIQNALAILAEVQKKANQLEKEQGLTSSSSLTNHITKRLQYCIEDFPNALWCLNSQIILNDIYQQETDVLECDYLN